MKRHLPLIFCAFSFALSNSAHAQIMDNSVCSNDTDKVCVHIHNTGEIPIVVRAHVAMEDGIREASPGKDAFYQFITSNGSEQFTIMANFPDAQMDNACSHYEWATNLAQGQDVVVSNLTNGIYSYSFGYKKDPQSNHYMMVECDNTIH